jgi:hypothetical protein
VPRLFAQAGFKPPNLCLRVARITGVSHWHPAHIKNFINVLTAHLTIASVMVPLGRAFERCRLWG